MRIGIDLMGSDTPPEILLQAVLLASRQLVGMNLIVFGTQFTLNLINSIPNVATILSQASSRVEFHLIQEVIEADDDPLTAIRQKRNSSLMIGIRLLKKRQLDAFVTAGNTGALIAGATLSLSLLNGIKRPALLATLPTEKGYVAVIDVGGNVSCKAPHLVQFAQIGAAYQRCTQGIAIPKVGLLNIGVESKKGTSEVRQAYQILQKQMDQVGSELLKFEFIGNIEGREVFEGKADVLVTDGFTGNVLLKTSEGVSSFIFEHLQHALESLNQAQKESIFKYFKHQFDYDEYAGAIICGVDQVVVKCHGKSSTKGFLNGILGAADLVRSGFITQIKAQLVPLNPA